MKSSILALATAAALSLGASNIALAQDTAPLDPAVDGCAINAEGVETESGVATPTGESLVDETEDGDAEGAEGAEGDDSAVEDGAIPVDECADDDRFPGIGEGVTEGTVDADAGSSLSSDTDTDTDSDTETE